MKRIVTLFLSLVLLLSCLCAPASALFDPSLFYEVQARSAYIVNTDTNIIVYDKDSSRQVPAGGLTKYMTIALLLTNYADQLDNTFQMPFAISDYVHNSDNADMRSNETFTYREAVYAMLLYFLSYVSFVVHCRRRFFFRRVGTGPRSCHARKQQQTQDHAQFSFHFIYLKSIY